MAFVGDEMLVYVNISGDDANPQWSPVGGQRGFTINRTAAQIDGSDKLTSRTLAGNITRTISITGLQVANDAAQSELLNVFNDKRQVLLEQRRQGVAIFQYKCTVTTFNEDAPLGDMATFDAEFGVVGEPLPV